MKCPCEECISHAICKWERDIVCADLYSFIYFSREIPRNFVPNLYWLSDSNGNSYQIVTSVVSMSKRLEKNEVSM
jgi:hypothetical protein